MIDKTADKNENMSKILVAIGGSPSSMDAEGDAIEIARKINELNYNSLNKDIQHL